MATILEQLAGVPIFRDLPEASLKRLEKITQEKRFAAGEVIFEEGAEGVGLYLVTEGGAEATRGNTKLAEFGPGDFFGEMALLDHHRRSATVTTTGPTACLTIARWDFVSELRADGDIAVHMLEVMSRRLREADERLSAV